MEPRCGVGKAHPVKSTILERFHGGGGAGRKDQDRNTGWGQPGMAGNARLRSLGFITEARVQQSLRSG